MKTIFSCSIAALLAAVAAGSAEAQDGAKDTGTIIPPVSQQPRIPDLEPLEGPAADEFERLRRIKELEAAGELDEAMGSPPQGALGLGMSPEEAWGVSLADLPADEEIKRQIAGGSFQTYRVIRFSGGEKPGASRVDRWTGSLWLPDPRLTGKLTPVSIDLGDRTFADWVYRNRDGSVSKAVVDRRQRLVGVLTRTRAGAVLAAFDRDGDRMIDLSDILYPDGRQVVLIDEGKLRDILDAWQSGVDPDCIEAAAGTPEERGTVETCGSQDGGGGAAQGPGGRNEPGTSQNDDFIDRQCEKYAGSARPRIPGLGRYADESWWDNVASVMGGAAADELARRAAIRLYAEGLISRGAMGLIMSRGGVAGALFYEITFTPATAGSSESGRETGAFERDAAEADERPPGEPPTSGGETTCQEAGTCEEEDEEGGGSSGGTSSASDSGGSQPPPPDESMPPAGEVGDPDAWWADFCQRRAESQREYDENRDARGRRSSDEECNPADDPTAESGADAVRSPICADEEDEESGDTDLAGLIGGAAGGDCRGQGEEGQECEPDFRRSSTGRAGHIMVGFGDIVGLDPCPEETCREPE